MSKSVDFLVHIRSVNIECPNCQGFGTHQWHEYNSGDCKDCQGTGLNPFPAGELGYSSSSERLWRW